MTKALTLRLPDATHERLRKLAFDQRVSITSLILAALNEPQNDPLGCDECGRPATHVTTPGGFRFCDQHARSEQ